MINTKTPCIKCKNMAPFESLPKGSKRRLHFGQWGMVARGLAYCVFDKPTPHCLLGTSSACKRFSGISDQAFVAKRYAFATGLQKALESELQQLKERLKAKNEAKH